MILSENQIKSILTKASEERGTKIVEDFLNNLKPFLNSDDVKNVYDVTYEKMLEGHKTAQVVNGKYQIHIYMQPVYEYICRKCRREHNVLEIGCGSGSLLMALACQNDFGGDAGEYVGIDFNPHVIEQAMERVQKDGLKNCRFICCDANDFSSKQEYDYIILSDVIEHLSDRELRKLMNTCHELLSEGGELVMHTPNGLNRNCQTDSTLFSRLYYRVYSGVTGQKYKKNFEQLYYEQAHINVKSYRCWKRFFNNIGYSLKVKYDKECNEHDLFWKTLQQMLHLEGNMLLVAKKKVR